MYIRSSPLLIETTGPYFLRTTISSEFILKLTRTNIKNLIQIHNEANKSDKIFSVSDPVIYKLFVSMITVQMILLII